MAHPYQCLAVYQPSYNSQETRLLAACGPQIFSASLHGNSSPTVWSSEATAASEPIDEGRDRDGDAPPKKKLKTVASFPVAPNVIKLAISPDQQHAVAVTEDKCVRVFGLTAANGALEELSQRFMPKRPCAILITPANQILCGDKFGDVYSLPLVPAELATTAGAESVRDTTETVFKPAATNLTVHTGRNRKALEAQLKQKALAKVKEPLKFEHKLLLGHVSMLTDVVFTKRSIENKQRSYIITADRDEHIRVSRGPPQAYIIEGYCLSHTEFIRKLCLIPHTDLLVSGGGDDWLGVWDWPSFTLKSKLDLKKAVQSMSSDVVEDSTIAVSGIWVARISNEQDPELQQAIVVACEGVPAIFVLGLSNFHSEGAAFNAHRLSANPVDIVNKGKSIIVSLDARQEGLTRLQALRIKTRGATTKISADVTLQTALEQIDELTGLLSDDKTLDSLLYGSASLRKHSGGED